MGQTLSNQIDSHDSHLNDSHFKDSHFKDSQNMNSHLNYKDSQNKLQNGSQNMNSQNKLQNGSQNLNSHNFNDRPIKMLCMLYDYFDQRNDSFKYDSIDYFNIKRHYLKKLEDILIKNEFNLKYFYYLNQNFFILEKIGLESKKIKDKMSEIYYFYLEDKKKETAVIVNHIFSSGKLLERSTVSFSDDRRSNRESLNRESSNRFLSKCELNFFIQSEYKKVKKYVKGSNGDYLLRNMINKAIEQMEKKFKKEFKKIDLNTFYKLLKEIKKEINRIKIETNIDKLKNSIKAMIYQKGLVDQK